MYEYYTAIETLEVNINITICCLSRVKYDIIINSASHDQMNNFCYLLPVKYHKHRICKEKVVLGIGYVQALDD